MDVGLSFLSEDVEDVNFFGSAGSHADFFGDSWVQQEDARTCSLAHMSMDTGRLWLSENVSRDGDACLVDAQFRKVTVSQNKCLGITTVLFQELYKVSEWKSLGEEGRIDGNHDGKGAERFLRKTVRSIVQRLWGIENATARDPDYVSGSSRPFIGIPVAYGKADGDPCGALFVPGRVSLRYEDKNTVRDYEVRDITKGGDCKLPSDPFRLFHYVTGTFGFAVGKDFADAGSEGRSAEPIAQEDKSVLPYVMPEDRILGFAGEINDRDVSVALERIAGAVKNIRGIREGEPKADVRQLDDYFLPLAEKFARAYAGLENEPSLTARQAETKDVISRTLPEIAGSVEGIYSGLLEKNAEAAYLDIFSDAEAFRHVSSMSGLGASRKSLDQLFVSVRSV